MGNRLNPQARYALGFTLLIIYGAVTAGLMKLAGAPSNTLILLSAIMIAPAALIAACLWFTVARHGWWRHEDGGGGTGGGGGDRPPRAPHPDDGDVDWEHFEAQLRDYEQSASAR